MQQILSADFHFLSSTATAVHGVLTLLLVRKSFIRGAFGKADASADSHEILAQMLNR